MIEEKEKLVTEFQQLSDERKRLEDEIQVHEVRMNSILEPVPTLKPYLDLRDMEEREPPFETLVWEEDPLTGELVPERFLLEQGFGEAEEFAEPVVEGLRSAIDERRGRIQLISVKAAIAEAQLPEGDKQTKTRKRRGPKGPRKSTTLRRSTIKMLRKDRITGRRLCEELDKRKIPLPTDDLNFIHEQSWVKWFDSDKTAAQRQLSADFRRP